MYTWWARMTERVSMLFGLVAMCTSMLMMLLITADILLRLFLGRPIKGTFEITGLMLVILCFFGFAYAQVRQSHISVNIVVDKLPQRAKAILRCFSYLVYFCFILLITWRTFLYGEEARRIGQTTSILDISLAPFIYLAVLGSLVFCLAVLLDLVKTIAEAVHR